MDYFNIILIILAALTVMFTLFLCFIAIIAFLGWQNLRDLKEKQRIFLTQQKKVAAKAERDLGLKIESIKKLTNELEQYKSKIKKTTDFRKYEKRTDDLIKELKDAIREAENRISNLKISSTSEITSIGGPTFGVSTFGGSASSESQQLFGLSAFTKICGKCGKTYSDDPTRRTTVYSQCPYCGNLNY